MRRLTEKTVLPLLLVMVITSGCSGSSSDSDGGASDISSGSTGGGESSMTVTIVDTGQTACYDDSGNAILCPSEGEAFYGQDAQYTINPASYIDNGDGSVSDLSTGLMWRKSPGAKVLWSELSRGAASLAIGGYTDWRVPTIKELYSLINFNGVTGTDVSNASPYINTTYFDFSYGDTSAGERYIDAQYWSSTEYVSTTMNGDATVFGVNFADGRIKGYGRDQSDFGNRGYLFVRYVRGQTSYGVNSFADNGDGTITDHGTGLTFTQVDDGVGRTWQEALAYCESLGSGGLTDWRLPNAKELQSIVDYTRSPDTTGSPAIDPVFGVTSIIDGNGATNFPGFWTSATHLDGLNPGEYAVYIAFGEAQGYMEEPPDSGNYILMDVHGAGAQRSDPKIGDPSAYPFGHGPQGDVITIYNHVRCVR